MRHAASRPTANARPSPRLRAPIPVRRAPPRLQSVAPPNITASISSSLKARRGGPGRGKGMGGGRGRDIVNDFPASPPPEPAPATLCRNADASAVRRARSGRERGRGRDVRRSPRRSLLDSARAIFPGRARGGRTARATHRRGGPTRACRPASFARGMRCSASAPPRESPRKRRRPCAPRCDAPTANGLVETPRARRTARRGRSPGRTDYKVRTALEP